MYVLAKGLDLSNKYLDPVVIKYIIICNTSISLIL